MEDASSCQVDAVISNKAIPIGCQAGILFDGIRSLEVFIYYGCDWVDRGENFSCCDFFDCRRTVFKQLLVSKYNIYFDGKRS